MLPLLVGLGVSLVLFSGTAFSAASGAGAVQAGGAGLIIPPPPPPASEPPPAGDESGSQEPTSGDPAGPPTIQSDKTDYAPGSTVVLTGSNWSVDPLSADVHIVVNDDVGQSWQRVVDVNPAADGTIQDTFTLPDWFIANYSVVATQVTPLGTLQANTSFTDASLDFAQCANDINDQDTSDDGNCSWIGSILQSENSKYREGMGVPQRFLLEVSDANGPNDNNTHTFVFKVQAFKASATAHAYDFLVSWPQAEVLAADGNFPFNPDLTDDQECDDVPTSGGANSLFNLCNNLHSSGQNALVDIPDSVSGYDGSQITGNGNAKIAPFEADYGNRQAKIYATGAISSATMVGTVDPSDAEYIQYTLTFTSNTTAFLIEFAGHLGIGDDNTGYTWPDGQGSSDINGGPYHFKLEAFDQQPGIGSLDNQLQGGDIIPVAQGNIIIKKETTPDASSQSFEFDPSYSGTNFNLTDGQQNDSGPLDAGTYTVSELTPLPAGWSLTNVTCVDPDSGTTTPQAGPSATIDLDPGETVTCTFNNTFTQQTPTVATAIHAGTDHTTDVQDTTIALGSSIHDQATVTGGSLGTPTGNVTFDYWTNGTCDGTATDTSGTFALSGGVADATTFVKGPLGPGNYSFKAHYAGDANYTAADGPCEDVTVGQGTTEVTTELHRANEDVVAIGGSVPLGTIMHDQASITDSSTGLSPSGNITFRFYANGTCDGAGTAAGSVAIVAGVAHPSDSTAALTPGSYSFQANYAGDDNFTGDLSPCEDFTVNRVTPTLETELHLADETVVAIGGSVPLGATMHDKATISDTVDGFAPSGSVTFTFFPNTSCTSGTGSGAGSVAIVAGVAHPSDPKGPLMAGGYSFQASYAGDDNFNSATSACEPFTVLGIHPGTIGFWRNWRNHYDEAQFQQLVNYLVANNPLVYAVNQYNTAALTWQKIDQIFLFGKSTPRGQMTLAQLTGLKLNLAISFLSPPLVQKNDDICLAGTINVASIPGAGVFFEGAGSDNILTIQQVVNKVEQAWLGDLGSSNPNQWKFDFNNGQYNTVINVLTGINEGDIITDDGC